MANGSGVSIGKLGEGRWRVRWRERLRAEDGKEAGWKQRERVVSTEAAAIGLRATVLRSIETDGAYEDPAQVVARVSTLDAAGAGYLRAQQARGRSPGTLHASAGALNRVARAIRQIRGIAPDAPIPATLVDRTLVHDVTIELQLTYGASSVYQAVCALLSVWAWAGDDPSTYPGYPPPPRALDMLRPAAPVYIAPPAPSLAETDAAIRHLGARATVTVGLAIAMRYTGLRISQVQGARLKDLDPQGLTLIVRVGKSKREKAMRRIVPVSPAFLVDVAPYLGVDPEGAMIASRGTTFTHRPTESLTSAWEAATAAGQVRREVWRPEVREYARPDHAFRAAFQAHLMRNGVRSEVIDGLVGHAGNTRTRHYAGAEEMMGAMREAVDQLPPIDWAGPLQEADSNVVAMPERRRGHRAG